MLEQKDYFTLAIMSQSLCFSHCFPFPLSALPSVCVFLLPFRWLSRGVASGSSSPHLQSLISHHPQYIQRGLPPTRCQIFCAPQTILLLTSFLCTALHLTRTNNSPLFLRRPLLPQCVSHLPRRLHPPHPGISALPFPPPPFHLFKCIWHCDARVVCVLSLNLRF